MNLQKVINLSEKARNLQECLRSQGVNITSSQYMYPVFYNWNDYPLLKSAYQTQLVKIEEEIQEECKT